MLYRNAGIRSRKIIPKLCFYLDLRSQRYGKSSNRILIYKPE